VSGFGVGSKCAIVAGSCRAAGSPGWREIHAPGAARVTPEPGRAHPANRRWTCSIPVRPRRHRFAFRPVLGRARDSRSLSDAALAHPATPAAPAATATTATTPAAPGRSVRSGRSGRARRPEPGLTAAPESRAGGSVLRSAAVGAALNEALGPAARIAVAVVRLRFRSRPSPPRPSPRSAGAISVAANDASAHRGRRGVARHRGRGPCREARALRLCRLRRHRLARQQTFERDQNPTCACACAGSSAAV